MKQVVPYTKVVIQSNGEIKLDKGEWVRGDYVDELEARVLEVEDQKRQLLLAIAKRDKELSEAYERIGYLQDELRFGDGE